VYAGRLTQNKELTISTEAYGKALRALFDMWYYDPEYKIDIQPLYQIIGNLISGEPKECTFLKSCQDKFISIASDGSVYPCGRFDGIRELVMGDINKDSIEDIFESPIRKKLINRVNIIKECDPCKHKKICHGGCMDNAYNTGDIMKKDSYCATYSFMFEYISKAIKNQIRLLKNCKDIGDEIEWTFV